MLALVFLLLAAPANPAPTITIDDGPNYRFHARTLRLLQTHKVRAVWFVNGHFLQNPKNQKLLWKIVSAGHILGNHGWSHRYPCRLSTKQFRNELLRTEWIINRTLKRPTKHRLRLYRPPFGQPCHTKLAKRLGYRVMYWNRADIGSTSRQMIRTVLRRHQYNPPRQSVLLFHYHNYKLSTVLRRFFPLKTRVVNQPQNRVDKRNTMR